MPGGIRITLEGEERLIRKLMALGETAREEAKSALHECVGEVRNHAIQGIENGPKTGRVYRRRGVRHVASARDEYPAGDTGVLAGSIWADVDDGSPAGDDLFSINVDDLAEAEHQLIGEMGANADYAAPLEYKPAGRGGRPFMRRALAESQAFIRARFNQLRGKFR